MIHVFDDFIKLNIYQALEKFCNVSNINKL